MRIALMAMTEADAEGEPARLGGKPVAWHQLQAALAAGCERIACLVAAPGPALALLQGETERRKATFHAIGNARALAGLVSAGDTLLVIAPGILPDRDWLLQTLGGRAGIGVFPADAATVRGFERIDRDRAWAGVLASRGDAVEALSELPPDADPMAGLLRIALQRGVRPVEVPETWLDEGRWAILPGAAAAERFEAVWLDRRVPPPGLARPSDALAYRVARRALTSGKMPGHSAPALVAGSIALGVAGGAAGYLGHTVGGTALLLAGVFAGAIAAAFARFARAGSDGPARQWVVDVRDGVHDLSLVAIAASPAEFAGWPVPFAALVLVAAMRLARQPDAGPGERLFGDRAVVLGLLCGLASVGQFALGMAAMALTALALRLFHGRRTRG